MNFDTHINADYLMTVGALTAGLNMPEALKSRGEGKDEVPHGLPPYKPRRAFLVDEYPACPKDWMRSTGRIKSYFVPIVEGAGLWLDFNYCGSNHANHVAVVTSIQGVNAITGLPARDPQLEQYRDECPKHKKAFGPDRLCTDCGHKWPKQNYLASTAQPNGEVWLDGFRAEDGFIRQYVFSKQKMRGVAKAIIGDDRVFALGISFFLSKQPRPKPAPLDVRGYKGSTGAKYLGFSGPIGCDHVDMDNSLDMMSFEKLCDKSWSSSIASAGGSASISNSAGPVAPNGATFYSATLGEKMGGKKKSTVSRKDISARGGRMSASGKSMMRATSMASSGVSTAASAPMAVNMVQVEQLEVAAGARLNQRIWDDANDLDFWQKEPEGIIVINYCTEADAEKILAAGKIDLSGHKEGFLQKIPVGNP